MQLFAKYKQVSLIIRIIIGLIVGTVLGLLVPSWGAIGLLGELFIGTLKGIAPVLVFFLIVGAISKYNDDGDNHFGTVIVLYLVATLLSAVAAVFASFIFRIELVFPSAPPAVDGAPKDLGTILNQLLMGAIVNPVEAISKGNYLAILFWAMLIGFALRLASAGTKRGLEDISSAIQAVATTIIEFAPFGIAGLIHTTIAKSGLSGLTRYSQLIFLLVGTMVFVYLVLYPLMIFLMTHQNPYPLTFWTLKVSGIPAFFTRSGAVNIPINLQAAKNLGLNEESYAVSIPLGGSANSGGAAITISIMTLAACNTLGITVSLPLAILLCFFSALASTGVSGIAGGSLLVIPMAAGLFGISNDVAMQVVGIGFIIGVIQDSVETAVNSASDLLFTATAEYFDLRRAGKPVDMTAAVKHARTLE